MQENGDAELVYTGNRRYKPALLIMPDDHMSLRYRLSIYVEGGRYRSELCTPGDARAAEDFYHEVYRAVNTVVKLIVKECRETKDCIEYLAKRFPSYEHNCKMSKDMFESYLKDVSSATDFQAACFITEDYFTDKNSEHNSILHTNRFNAQFTLFYDLILTSLDFITDCIDGYGLQKSFSICYDNRLKTPTVVGFIERNWSKKCI